MVTWQEIGTMEMTVIIVNYYLLLLLFIVNYYLQWWNKKLLNSGTAQATGHLLVGVANHKKAY